jgi:hypothetical protein
LDLLSQSHCTPSQEESDDYDFLWVLWFLIVYINV